MPDLTHWASVTPDVLALVTEDETRTFAELDANANRLARALRARGLVAGDAVALVAGNRPAFVETVYACQRAGYRLTTVNWHLTGDEASYIVNDCEARALIATDDVAAVAAATFRRRSRLHGGSRRRRRHRRVRVVRGCAGRRARRAGARSGTGHDDALHVGHHGTPQGRAPAARRRGGRGR